jgi:hypothetical protein
MVWMGTALPLPEVLQQTLEGAVADESLRTPAGDDGLVFLLITALGVAMALVYVPVRLFLTITARSRRLRLLQRIRRLRDDLGQPLPAPQAAEPPA